MTTELAEAIFIEDDLLDLASPGQKAHYKRLLAAFKARQTPLDYMLYVSPKARAYRHTTFLNEVLLALVEKRLYKTGPGPASIVVDVSEDEPNGRRVHPVTGEPVLYKLMTSMPPRIGKSYFLGEHFPAWFLTRYPDETVMYMSYGASLAERFSKLARGHVNEHPELGVTLDPTSSSVSEWNIFGWLGGFIARGFGGIPTGRGGNLLIDDAFQSGADAMSDNRRDFIYDQYVSSLITRVENECWTIVNGTRWHEDDLHGRLLAKEPDEWFVVNFPALAYDDINEDGISIDLETGTVDVLGRKPGQAICPQLYSTRFYERRREEDPFWFDAEYQGKPSGIGGSLFKEFTHYKRHVTTDNKCIYELFTGGEGSEFVSEDDCVRFATVDTALTDKETSDWTVMAIWDLDPWKRLILREIIRDRVTGDVQDDFIRENSLKWDVRVTFIEEVTSSLKLIQDMIAGGGITIWPLPADKNKKVRALPAAVLNKRKQMFIDRDAEWRSKYESELKKFDKDKNDDQVDVTSYAAVARDLIASRPLPEVKSKHGLTGFEARMAQLAHSAPEKPSNTGMVISA